MKISRILSAALLAAGLTLASCTSNEERAISEVKDLIETVQNCETVSELDMDELNAKYEELSKLVDKCNFTEEQRTEFYSSVGKLQGLFLQKAVSGGLGGMMKGLGGMMKGMSEGLGGMTEGIEEAADEVEDAASGMSDAIDAMSDAVRGMKDALKD